MHQEGKLDLKDSAMIVDSGSAADVEAWIKAGWSSGSFCRPGDSSIWSLNHTGSLPPGTETKDWTQAEWDYDGDVVYVMS